MKPILEPIPLGQTKTILGFSYEAADFDTPWHYHPQHELTYIEESTGTKLVGDFVGSYAPGELVLMRSNLPHCWKNISREDSSAKSVVIQWNKGVFPKVPELEPVFTLLRAAAKGILFDKDQTVTLLPIIRQLPHLHGYELYIQLLQLLTQLSHCTYNTLSEASFIDYLPTAYGSRMSTIHDFVSKNFNRKIYLNEVATLVTMSEQSFSRFFSKMMGRPFFTFLNEYRVNMAVRMLLDTDKSIAEIAYASGYESLPFFHKQFSKFLGSSPLAYRKKHHQKLV